MNLSFLKMASYLFLVFIALGTLVTSYPFINEKESALNSTVPSTGHHRLVKRSTHRPYCGNDLINALSRVCNGGGGGYADPTAIGERDYVFIYIGEDSNNSMSFFHNLCLCTCT